LCALLILKAASSDLSFFACFDFTPHGVDTHDVSIAVDHAHTPHSTLCLRGTDTLGLSAISFNARSPRSLGTHGTGWNCHRTPPHALPHQQETDA
jgi:hypothetical protein